MILENKLPGLKWGTYGWLTSQIQTVISYEVLEVLLLPSDVVHIRWGLPSLSDYY
jgi:hypothetical protein